MNENLEKENATIKEGGVVAGTKTDTDSSSLSDEVRRLQAQNTALQKNLTGTMWYLVKNLIDFEVIQGSLEIFCLHIDWHI